MLDESLQASRRHQATIHARLPFPGLHKVDSEREEFTRKLQALVRLGVESVKLVSPCVEPQLSEVGSLHFDTDFTTSTGHVAAYSITRGT